MIQSELVCKPLRTLEELKLIRSDVDSLIAHQVQPACFLCSAWLIEWCQNYLQQTDSIWCIAFYDVDKLVGIAPFYLKSHGKLMGKELCFIGQGEPEESEVASEYPDVVVLKEYRPSCLSLLSNLLASQQDIKRLTLNRVLPSSSLFEWLKGLPDSWHLEQQRGGYRFVISIECSLESQLTKIKQSTLRRQFRNWNKRLPDVQIIHHRSKSDIEGAITQLSQLHNGVWQARGHQGVFSHPVFLQFHQNMIQHLQEDKRLCLFSVKLDSTVVAIFYGWTFNGTLFYYQSGIARMSKGAGALMHLCAMNYARDAGLQYYDLMQGQLGSYKNNFSEPQESMFNLSARRGVPVFFMYLSQFVRRFRSQK